MTIFKKKNGREEPVADVQFNVHKFSSRPKPENPKDIVIISCFSEFGCEVMGAMYCIPKMKLQYPDKYFIVMGWYGRDYLYRHLVDEFWETKEESQWLRDYALAFHNNSKNLKNIEKAVSKLGTVIGADKLGAVAVGNECNDCYQIWGEIGPTKCKSCQSENITKGLFSDPAYWKKRVTPIPVPSKEKMEKAGVYLGPNPVAITARNRKTYGRNLQPEFYEKLIYLIEDMGYDPIWIGEKQTTLECPVPHIIDLTRKPEARDLEFTLAIVRQCKFTVQFWTASTRLAGIMGVPYLIFESPDQLFGNGQESYRLSLCTMGKKKIALCHYLNVYNDNDTAISLVRRCVEEMQRDNWNDIIGMVDEPAYVAGMRESNLHRLGGI